MINQAARITVTHRHDLSFEIRVRGCSLISDEPVTLGGEDEGPTPVELMIAGLAACAADAATRKLVDLGLPYEPVEVTADFDWDPSGTRLHDISIQIVLPSEIDTASRNAAMAAALQCPARRLLVEPPMLHYECMTADAALLSH